jgi:hypothetical protein
MPKDGSVCPHEISKAGRISLRFLKVIGSEALAVAMDSSVLYDIKVK